MRGAVLTQPSDARRHYRNHPEMTRKRPHAEVDLAEVAPNPAAGPTTNGAEQNGSATVVAAKGETIRNARECPYLATINRAALDPDAEPICSVTLSTRNVYICLVCGKYLQGRGPRTPAYVHSVETGHHLCVHARNTAVYCLPDGYRVADVSLADIADALAPSATTENATAVIRCADGMRRTRGVVALDNLGQSDYVSVVLQLLSAAVPVRDALLAMPAPETEPADRRTALLAAVSLLVRKIWAGSALRAHIAPHSVCRLLGEATSHRFVSDKQRDPVALLAWMFATYSRGKTHRKFAKVLRAAFQGRMLLTTLPNADVMSDSVGTTKEQPFWFLTLDLPPKPLFKDSNEEVLVQQVTLEALLSKYDGVTRQHVVKTDEWRTYKLVETPPWLLLNIARFERSKFADEKNQCVVQTPVDRLEVAGKNYRLVAMISHDGESSGGRYTSVVKQDGQWYEISDDGVKKTMAQLATLKETYVLLYRRCEGE